MSDQFTPRGYRMIAGFSVHTFRLVSAHGAAREVPLEVEVGRGLPGLGREAAHRRAEPTSIAATCVRQSKPASTPEWELGVQLIP
ncbi:catalase [Streptomyces yanii]